MHGRTFACKMTVNLSMSIHMCFLCVHMYAATTFQSFVHGLFKKFSR
jgi:hypothetical protein